jgi:microcystin degradation protein MlrC
MTKHVSISVIVFFLGSSLMSGFAAADKPESAGKPEWVEKHKAEKEEEKAEKDAEKAERKAEKEREKAERELENQKDADDD